MKKWWLYALVFTLALSLTSCSKPNLDNQSYDYGWGQCDGPGYSFDAYVIREPNNPNSFSLSLMPVSLDQPGDVIQVYIANKSPNYKLLVPETVASNNEIYAGTLTESDLETFDILAVVPQDGSGANFLTQTPATYAICDLPRPGDGIDGTGVPTTKGAVKSPAQRKHRTALPTRLIKYH